jgi:hypothetical protein
MSYIQSSSSSSPFCMLTFSTSSGQPDTFSQSWVAGATPVITAATGKGYHSGFITITQSNIGAIASVNDTTTKAYQGQYRGDQSGSRAASDDAYIGYGREAGYATLTSAGFGFTIDTTRSRSIIMRSE